MKAISLWQPWASAIADGNKKIETRGWSTRYRGTILIHAAKHFSKAIKDMCYARCIAVDQLPFGAIVAVADLAGVQTTEYLNLKINYYERQWGDYTPGRFGWQLKNIRAFKEPIHYRGAQGLFDVPDSVVAEAIAKAA